MDFMILSNRNVNSIYSEQLITPWKNAAAKWDSASLSSSIVKVWSPHTNGCRRAGKTRIQKLIEVSWIRADSIMIQSPHTNSDNVDVIMYWNINAQSHNFMTFVILQLEFALRSNDLSSSVTGMGEANGRSCKWFTEQKEPAMFAWNEEAS